MIFIALAALACIGVPLVLLLRKVSRIDRAVWNIKSELIRDAAVQFQQIEALAGLYRSIHPLKGLPSTRGWAASPDMLRALAEHVLSSRPSHVVECSSGVSTIVLARCLQLLGGGHVYSLEHDSRYAELSRHNLSQQGLAEWATVLCAPLVDVPSTLGHQRWYDLTNLPDLKIDMLVIDGPPGNIGRYARYPAGQQLFPKLADKATIFLDDASRADERKILAMWETEWPDLRFSSIEAEKGLARIDRMQPGKIGTESLPPSPH